MRSNDFDHRASFGHISLLSGVGILAPVLLFIVLRLFLGPAFYADSGFWLFQHGGIGEIVDFSTNAFWQWTFEPFVAFLLSPLSWGFDIYLCLLLISGALGTRCYYDLLPKIGIDTSPYLLSPALPGCLVLVLCGADTLVLSFLALFPWLLRDLSLLLSGYASARGVFWRLFFLSIASCLLLGQLAFLAALLAFLVISIDLELKYSRHFGFVVSIGLGFPLLRILSHPAPRFPDYPADAHVVSAWGLVERYRVLIGSEMEVQFLDWTYSRELFQGFSLLLFVVSLLLFVLKSWKGREGFSKSFQGIGSLACLLSVCLFLDTAFLSTTLSQIMPIQAFARLIPEMNYLPLARIACGVGFACWGMWAGMLGRAAHFMACLLLLFFCIQRIDAGRCIFSPLELREKKLPVLNLLKGSPENYEQDAKILFSPSYAVIRERGWSALQQSQVAVAAIRVESENIRLSASKSSESLSLLTDKSLKTRWSSEGPQAGNEWIQVEFSERAQRLDGILLELGNFVTDFPRGLLFSTYEPDGKLCEVQRFEPWEGSVEWSPGGFPFYGAQQLVKVRFFSACRVSRLKIEQTGSDPRFSWSVAELHIFVHQN